MKHIILSLLLSIHGLSYAIGSTYGWIFDRVVDGDTIAFVIPNFPAQIQKVSIRVYNIDTPESTHLAKCEEERKLGIRAKEYVKSIVNKDNVTFNIVKWDKWGGRVLADVYVDNEPLSDLLIKKGFARYYRGEAKGDYWCTN